MDPISVPLVLVVIIMDPGHVPLDLIHLGLRGSVSANHATTTVSGEEMSLQVVQARGKQAQVHRTEQR